MTQDTSDLIRSIEDSLGTTGMEYERFEKAVLELIKRYRELDLLYEQSLTSTP